MARKANAKSSKQTKKVQKTVATGVGRVYVSTTFNNTIVTVTDEKGEAVAWSSGGAAGFKGTRKATPFAATSVVEQAIKKAKEAGVQREDSGRTGGRGF